MQSSAPIDLVKRDPQVPQGEVLSSLASYILKKFREARDWRRRFVEPMLMECYRQSEATYDPERAADIKKAGGCDQFFDLTGPKLAVWMSLVQEQVNPKTPAFTLEVSPIADIPRQKAQVVEDKLVSMFRRLKSAGIGISEEEMEVATIEVLDVTEDAVQKEARKRAKRHQRLIRDQAVEGGLYMALLRAARDMGIYPYAVLKGPVKEAVKVQEWDGARAVTKVKERATWPEMSIWDFYCDPHSARAGDGYTIEVARFDPIVLQEMKGRKGWSDAAIAAVLAAETVTIDLGDDTSATERAELAGTPEPISEFPKSKPEALLWYGAVRGRHLIEWGMSAGEIDSGRFYEIKGMLIGSWVVRAEINPDEMGAKPYFSTSFDIRQGMKGKSPLLLMRGSQIAFNTCMRAAVNGLVLANGLHKSVDLDAFDANYEADVLQVYPNQVNPYRSSKIPNSNREPVHYFQMKDNSQASMELGMLFRDKADDDSAIPRFAQASSKLGGAGDTATGLGMLTDMMLKSISRALGNIDRDLMLPSLGMQVRENNRNYPDPGIKGDVNIVPCGVVLQAIQAEIARRGLDFLKAVNNPTDLQIFTLARREKMYRNIMPKLDLDAEEILGDEVDEVVAAPRGVAGQVMPGAQPQVVPGGEQAAGMLPGAGMGAVAAENTGVAGAGRGMSSGVSR